MTRRPNVVVVLLDDVGYGAAATFGGAIDTPALDTMCGEGLTYNRSPHDGDLLSDPGVAADGPRRARGRRRDRPEQRQQPPRLRGRAPPGQRHHRDDPAAERLRHRLHRQMAPVAAVGVVAGRAVRPLAHRPGIRQVLRVPRRRDPPVPADPVRGDGAGGTAVRPRLPPDRGSRGPVDPLDPDAAVDDARPAVLPLPRAGRHPRAAARPARVERPLPGTVRPRLGRRARPDPGTADRARHRPRGHPDDPAPGRDPELGQPHRRRTRRRRTADGGVRGVPGAHRRAGSSTSSATTAAAPKAAFPAASTTWARCRASPNRRPTPSRSWTRSAPPTPTDSDGRGRGGTLVLTIDGTEAAGDRIAATPPAIFSIDETFDIGLNTGSPVGDHPPAYPFQGGEIERVDITLD